MKTIIFAITFFFIFSIAYSSDVAILGDDLSIYLPEIIYDGKETGFEAKFDYNQEKNCWILVNLEQNPSEEHPILDKINNLRDNPLVWDDKLAQAALMHCKDMEKNSFFSHTGSDNSSFVERVRRTDFSGFPKGENIARGSDPFILWKNSEGHYKNMVEPTITHMGYAEYNGYHTMVTGRK